MDTLRSTVPLLARQSWPMAFTLLAGFIVWLVAWYWDTVTSMAAIWYRSDTFAHGFVVFPIAGWLAWQKRRELAALTPAPSTSMLPIVAMLAAAVMWLAGDLADVLAARQFAWMTLLVAGIWLIVGDTLARRLAFPLAFLYFAVPIGEFLLPTLIEWTADFTVAALRLSGVPVWREGMMLQIPTGSWSIVEACSGLRYLIASAMVGVLYAYLAYRSLSRRIAFVAASLAVPILANWLRAYMIVMIGHLSGNRLAVGIDHIIYGWIFFGVVMLLLFWVGAFWREDTTHETEQATSAPAMPRSPIVAPRWSVALLGALAVTAAVPGIVRLLHGYDLPGGHIETAPVLGEWQPVPGSLVSWTPQFTQPRATIASTYARAAERSGLYIALYYDQDRNSKLVSSQNQLLRTTDRSGYIVSENERTIDTGNGPFAFKETVLRVRDGRILARSWFWIDGVSTADRIRAKLAQARSRLRGHGDMGAIIVVYALLPAEGNQASAEFDELTRHAAAALPTVLSNRLRAGDPR